MTRVSSRLVDATSARLLKKPKMSPPTMASSGFRPLKTTVASAMNPRPADKFFVMVASQSMEEGSGQPGQGAGEDGPEQAHLFHRHAGRVGRGRVFTYGPQLQAQVGPVHQVPRQHR